MKKLILTALIAGMGCVGSAAAAGWNGTFIGIDGGYGWAKVKQPYSIGHGTPLTSTEADVDAKGWLAGVRVDQNWASTNWLFGLTADANWNNFNGDDGGSGGSVNEVVGKAQATLSSRLGFFWGPNTLLYGRFGYSWWNADLNDNTTHVSHTATFNGMMYGAGLEFKLSPISTARIEWRHDAYKQRRINFTPAAYDLGPDPNLNTLSVGLSWHI